ncbi:MAG: exodeoxyribonuclease VII small subunit [candidate division Zixibacteria bacterium]|nr:exodeoxyribonuclease VII small subunit [candidate division Zixibacteria bacterium]MDH3938540.1 exodeoxyribonuclease VII small subunit [candidate division Zixibacteria bacterium]MDH4035175.1 exodeoxyribonuclease VII small subunit [candidate division Zixibacteria bacterium]
MTAKKKTRDFESALERLEEITEQLESGEASLEQSIELYTEGLQLAKDCHQKLNAAEKKIKIITEKNNLPVETDFESAEADV